MTTMIRNFNKIIPKLFLTPENLFTINLGAFVEHLEAKFFLTKRSKMVSFEKKVSAVFLNARDQGAGSNNKTKFFFSTEFNHHICGIRWKKVAIFNDKEPYTV